MNALIVGFGVMGCRHAQALLASQQYRAVCVIEPSDEKFSEGLLRIGATPASVSRLRTLGEFNHASDIAIIATSSAPRYEIIKTCIEKGLKHFLIEKIAFQSIAQFDGIIELLELRGAKAYCNFVNRYFPNYKELKSRLSGAAERLLMSVCAGNIGLGCNAIHYMDLFEYLAGANISTASSRMLAWERENKRGNMYREFSGMISAVTADDDILNIYFDPSHSGSVCLDIHNGKESFWFSEGDRKEFSVSQHAVHESEFAIIPTSRLSHILADDILNDRSLLPTVAASRNAHRFLFREVNRALGLPDTEETLCPIT